MDCSKCGMGKEHLEYWITHQTMQDNTIWCVNVKDGFIGGSQTQE
jgi:hypothetical protein